MNKCFVYLKIQVYQFLSWMILQEWCHNKASKTQKKCPHTIVGPTQAVLSSLWPLGWTRLYFIYNQRPSAMFDLLYNNCSSSVQAIFFFFFGGGGVGDGGGGVNLKVLFHYVWCSPEYIHNHQSIYTKIIFDSSSFREEFILFFKAW